MLFLSSRPAPLILAVAAVALLGCKAGDGPGTTPEIEVGTITIDTMPPPLERGVHKVFTATVKDVKGKVVSVPLVWRSTNETAAAFLPDGRLLAKDTGRTTVTARSEARRVGRE